MRRRRIKYFEIACLFICLAFQASVQAQSVRSDDGSGPFHESFEFSFNDEASARRQTGGMFSAFFGLDGSKQPQDFGVNANLGGRASFNYSAPLIADRGIGFQIGTAVAASGNAVQVFELLGESKDRFQSFTTVGVFQRTPSGFNWGAVYDFLFQDSYDEFKLGQWRLQASFDLAPQLEIGTTFNLASRSGDGNFNATPIRLEPIEMLNVYIRRDWNTGVSTRLWAGVADGHNEANAVTGSLPRKQNQLLFGADIFSPLNNWMAIYGEANIIMPADTGSVDAFLGIEVIPGGIWKKGRENHFRSMFSVASSPSFSTDLSVR